MHPRASLFLPLFCLFAVGCVGTSIGDPCIPEAVPEGGFVAIDTYVETASASCQTRVCVAVGLQGDTSADCTERCATEQDIRDHVYCTAACQSDEDCPDDFRCREAGDSGLFCLRRTPEDP